MPLPSFFNRTLNKGLKFSLTLAETLKGKKAIIDPVVHNEDPFDTDELTNPTLAEQQTFTLQIPNPFHASPLWQGQINIKQNLTDSLQNRTQSNELHHSALSITPTIIPKSLQITGQMRWQWHPPIDTDNNTTTTRADPSSAQPSSTQQGALVPSTHSSINDHHSVTSLPANPLKRLNPTHFKQIVKQQVQKTLLKVAPTAYRYDSRFELHATQSDETVNITEALPRELVLFEACDEQGKVHFQQGLTADKAGNTTQISVLSIQDVIPKSDNKKPQNIRLRIALLTSQGKPLVL